LHPGRLLDEGAHRGRGNGDRQRRITNEFAVERKPERDPALKGKIKFSGDEVLITINDRLVAPNSAETLQTLKPDLDAAATELFGPARVTLSHNKDPRQRFSVGIRTFEPFSVDRLIANVG